METIGTHFWECVAEKMEHGLQQNICNLKFLYGNQKPFADCEVKIKYVDSHFEVKIKAYMKAGHATINKWFDIVNHTAPTFAHVMGVIGAELEKLCGRKLDLE